ncbi:unnamed protein product, partial [Mesorhabditis belari]|uniref:Actin interacting protein 3 C-terminal domain-containing protein n=1 Tax=Mesorhabditis belari TaxID=2138241 RepID=A0AAF3E8X9_9BILA
MSRLFNWKLRLGLGRKTPEPKESMAVTIQENSIPPTIQNQPNDQKSPRVRFDEKASVQEVWTNGPPVDYQRSPIQSVNGPPVIGSPLHGSSPPKPYPGYSPPTGYPINSVHQLGTIQEFEFDRGVSKKDQRANEWKYADDVKVTIAPIAHAEVDEQPRYSRDTTRASTVLQNLREQADHIELNEKRRQQINNHNQPIGLIQSQPSPLPEHPDMNRSLQIPRATPTPQSGRLSAEPQSSKRDWEHDMNVIFLQANDEVKRVVLPPRIDAMEQIKMAFVRVFPHITRGYIEQPFVKIYIQDPVKGLFYELDDLREVRHKTVLRLREQRANGVASPVRHLDHPDYHSEAEVDDANRHRFVSLARPASAMARARDPYYDSYSSDASDSRANSVTRSGSATPIIDKEARDRMETMERQLAGLSSLVHTALVSKGMPESAQRDMADLRRQILALHPDPDRLPNESPAPASELSTSPSNRRDLVTLRERIHATGTDCRQLRSTAQANAQEAQNMLQEASLEITRMISQQIAGSTHPVIRRSQTPQIQAKDDFEEGRMRDEHETRTRALIDTLATFEKNVESLRTSVLSANRKLKMSEVEQLTEQLTQIGRTAASIKTDFPSLQSKIETRIKQDMERVVRDEKYIREETQAVDQSLRRCKALANIMVTMKKLAMVQDPSLGRGHHAQRNSKNTNVSLTLPPPIPLSSHLPPPPPPPSTEQIPPPPVPPSPNNYSRQETPQTSTLDSVLDEVQSIPSVPHPPAVSSLMHPSIQAVPTGQPPRPPSRTSVSDVRSKFKQPPELPEQIRSLIEDAKRSSPSLDSQANERTPKTLDERQRELAEKQRQLTSQFHQMQSLPQSQSS